MLLVFSKAFMCLGLIGTVLLQDNEPGEPLYFCSFVLLEFYKCVWTKLQVSSVHLAALLTPWTVMVGSIQDKFVRVLLSCCVPYA